MTLIATPARLLSTSSGLLALRAGSRSYGIQLSVRGKVLAGSFTYVRVAQGSRGYGVSLFTRGRILFKPVPRFFWR